MKISQINHLAKKRNLSLGLSSDVQLEEWPNDPPVRYHRFHKERNEYQVEAQLHKQPR